MHLDRDSSVQSGLGSLPGIIPEDNFGFYQDVNPDHRCSANPIATTQWWLGGP